MEEKINKEPWEDLLTKAPRRPASESQIELLKKIDSWGRADNFSSDIFIELETLENQILLAKREEYEKLIEIFDNLKYNPTGETDLVDKKFICGILREELSKLTTK